jgi:hypothetical protein
MPSGNRSDFSKVILAHSEDEASVRIMIGQVIGRRMLSTRTRPDPIYKVRWSHSSPHRDLGNIPVELTLRRSLREGVHVQHGFEGLEIVKVSSGDVPDRDLSVEDIELQLYTLEEETFWMDAAVFQMDRMEVKT